MRGNLLKWGMMPICFVLFACSSNKSEDLCSLSVRLVESDQYYRNQFKKYLSPEFYFLDSLIVVHGGKDWEDYRNMPQDLKDSLKVEAESFSSLLRKNERNKIDSLWRLQKQKDQHNTQSLLQAIESIKVGELDAIHLGCLSNALLVFVHADSTYFDKIETALTKLKVQEWNKNRYDHIKWHLNGRSD